MTEHNGVMIYGEVIEGKLASITTELLGIGRKLADELGQELSAILIGSDISSHASEIISFGADKVYLIDKPELKDYRTDSHINVMENISKQMMPQIILLGQTNTGRDLAPRLAFRLGTSVAMGVIELAIDPDSKLLLQTKPVYGGNAQIIVTTDQKPQIATVRPKSMSPLEPDTARQGEIIQFDPTTDLAAVRTKVIQKVKAEVTGIKLEDAEVVVTGGRGIGGAEGFQQLEELANLLKGAVGSSRPPVDDGWVPEAMQVGLTGKIVAPNLYLAVALSGSSQHMSGCSGSKNIVAINKDSEANIVKLSRYAVIGDWKKVIPALTTKVKELLEQ